MSISTEISRLQGAKTTISEKMEALGVTEAGDLLDVIAEKIDGIAALGNLTTQLTPSKTQLTIGAGYTTGGTVKITTETQTVTPTKSVKTVTPSGSNVLSSVTVEKIPDAYQDVSSVTATAADVLANKVIVDKNGAPLTGTIPIQGAVTQTLAAGGKAVLDAGYYSSINITASDLASQTDGTATAADILTGKTAYVDGVKVTGGIPIMEPTAPGKTSGSYHYQVNTVAAGQLTSGDDNYYVGLFIPKNSYTGDNNYIRTLASNVATAIGLDPDKMLNDSDTKEKIGVAGTIVPKGALSKTMTGLTDDTDSVPIDPGYYTGGTVSLTSDIENLLAAI